MSDTVTAETLTAVVLNERYRDACVAHFEAQELAWSATMGVSGHPWKCQCDPCAPLSKEYERLSAEASRLRFVAREARKALGR